MSASLTIVRKAENLKITSYQCPGCGCVIRRETDVKTSVKQEPCSQCKKSA